MTPSRAKLMLHMGYRPAQLAAAYLIAAVLPGFCSVIVVHFGILYEFPLALHFLVLVLVATLGGLGPATLAVVCSIVARLLQAWLYPHPPLGPGNDLFRFLIFIVVALFISLTGRRRRSAESRTEDALAQLKERNDTLVETLHNNKCASWSLDLDSGTSARWYSGSYPVFGRPFAEIEALPSLLPLLHPEDQLRFPTLIHHMRSSTEPIVFDYRSHWPNGELHWLEMRATRVPGSRCRWRGVTLDITERKHSEAAILNSEKLAAMGRLASTVAHEINNPLEAVTNLLYLANSDQSLDRKTRDYLSLAERELSRLGNITRLTLGFVRTSAIPAQVNLAQTMDDVISILQHRFDARGIAIERHYEPTLHIAIAPHELRQIAVNLIANAADAVPAVAARIAIRAFRDDGHANLVIADNGSGIPASNLARVFDPFFTTKSEVGTGIGLWVTRELVEKNHGDITVESGDLPEGFHTSFQVRFPIAPTPSA